MSNGTVFAFIDSHVCTCLRMRMYATVFSRAWAKGERKTAIMLAAAGLDGEESVPASSNASV